MTRPPLGELSAQYFLAQYWQKKPLVIRNAIPDICPPVSPQELAGLACEQDVESRIVINNNDTWQLKHGPFSSRDFTTLPPEDWTLLVQAVDHFIPEAEDLLRLFDFIPRWRIDDLMISYACKGGGVGPHYDNYDVFLIQAQGQRLWHIGGHYNEQSPICSGLPVRILQNFMPQQSWLLEAGDILYVPPGIGHHGIAASNDCLTCSVGFRAPSHLDILREYTDYLGEKLNESTRYSDPGLKPAHNTGEISAEVFSTLKTVLSQYIENQSDLEDWFGRYITTPKYDFPDYQPHNEENPSYNIDELKEFLASGGCMQRNLNSRFAFIKQQKQHALYVNGEKIESVPDNDSLIETLCCHDRYYYRDFRHTHQNFQLLHILLTKGALFKNS